MAVKVSVVVPVYNPGDHIDDCIASVLRQSLPASEMEVVFVDDGSTDGTGERLDRLAAEHPDVVRVKHIENSGWPGRPRNVGMDAARGEFVYFVDNDDWIEDEALERLHATAARTGADIVIGKVVGHGKPVPNDLFRCNRDDARLDRDPLLTLLTPHKLFRRAFLAERKVANASSPRSSITSPPRAATTSLAIRANLCASLAAASSPCSRVKAV